MQIYLFIFILHQNNHLYLKKLTCWTEPMSFMFFFFFCERICHLCLLVSHHKGKLHFILLFNFFLQRKITFYVDQNNC